MKFKYIYTLLLPAILLLNSCIKDKSNLTYLPENKVDIKFPESSYTIFIGDTLKLEPIRTFASPAELSDYDHEWYLNGKLYSKEPKLVFPGTENNGYYVYYNMTDKKNKITYSTTSYVSVSVSSPFINGWGILYEDKNGNSEIAQVNPTATAGTYTDYTGLYFKANNAIMGTQPVKMSAYNMRGTRGLFIIQKGTPGALDLSGIDFKRKLVAAQSFTRGAPDDFDPTDMAFFNTADLLVNRNGDLYGRFFNGAAVFTIPWMSSPITISKGNKITDIWDSWYIGSVTVLMYDDLNKRVLQSNLSSFSTGGGITIDVLPTPVNGYPADYVSPQNLGDWKYVWGGTFNESYGNMTGAMLIKSPTDAQLYLETFQYKNGMGQPNVLTPVKKVLFPGTSIVSSQSIYKPLKNRDYLFFTAGADNKQLYYYDMVSGNIKLYETFSSKITGLATTEDFQQIGVGLAEGKFVIYDIANSTLASGQSKKLHELSDLGKVVDVIFKGTKY